MQGTHDSSPAVLAGVRVVELAQFVFHIPLIPVTSARGCSGLAGTG